MYEGIANSPVSMVDYLGLEDAPCKCGPDVTASVAATIRAIEAAFADDNNPGFHPPRLQEIYRRRACMALFDNMAKMAWEIAPLGKLGVGTALLEDYPAGIAQAEFDGSRSVTYHGACVYAGALNYLAFGKMCRLCHDKFASRPFVIHPPPLGTTPRIDVYWTVDWSKVDMIAAVMYQKSTYHGVIGQLHARLSLAARVAAEHGYDGTDSADPIFGPEGYGPSTTQWPAGPMRWSWNGVHSY